MPSMALLRSFLRFVTLSVVSASSFTPLNSSLQFKIRSCISALFWEIIYRSSNTLIDLAQSCPTTSLMTNGPGRCLPATLTETLG